MTWHRHKWTRWVLGEGVIYRGGKALPVDIERRECVKCGKHQQEAL